MEYWDTLKEILANTSRDIESVCELKQFDLGIRPTIASSLRTAKSWLTCADFLCYHMNLLLLLCGVVYYQIQKKLNASHHRIGNRICNQRGLDIF